MSTALQVTANQANGIGDRELQNCPPPAPHDEISPDGFAGEKLGARGVYAAATVWNRVCDRDVVKEW
jgi:hypothetical protein